MLKTFTEFLEYLNSLFVTSAFCYAKPLQTIGCARFWGICFLTAMLLLSYIFVKLARNILKDRADWNIYLIKKTKREKVADEETMSKHVWTGD